MIEASSSGKGIPTKKINSPLFESRKDSWRGQPCGREVKFARSALAAQGFAGADPRHGHGTIHQAMLRRRHTWHNQKDLQLQYTTMYLGGFGEKKKKRKKED